MAKILQLKRNATLYVGHAAALSALQAKLAAETYVGEPIIVRYKTSADSNDERILLGIVGADGKYEIFDNYAASSEISDAIAALDSVQTSTDGTNVQVKVTEVDGKITDVNITTDNSINNTDLTNAINALDSSVDATAADGNQYFVLTGVTETNGKLAEKTEVKLAAVAKTGVASDVANDAIVASATKVAVSGTNVHDQIDSIAETMKSIQDNAAKYKVVKLTTAEVTALGDANVKEAYKVMSYTGDWDTATDKIQVGDTIKIYKDQTLKSASFANQTLTLTYILADGSESSVDIDMSSLILETEVENGIQAIDHKLSVKIDSESGKVTTSAGQNQTVLSTGANGVKVANIQEAIDYATTQLGITAAGDNYITAAVDSDDNKKINVSADVQNLTSTAGTPGVYNPTTGAQTTEPVNGTLIGVTDSLVDGADVASKIKTYVDGAVAIEAARNDAKNKADIYALNSSQSATAASDNVYSVLTGVTQTNGVLTGKAEVTLAAVAKTGDAADVSIADSGNKFTATNVEAALAEIVTTIEDNEQVVSAALNDLNDRVDALNVFDCGTY